MPVLPMQSWKGPDGKMERAGSAMRVAPSERAGLSDPTVPGRLTRPGRPMPPKDPGRPKRPRCPGCRAKPSGLAVLLALVVLVGVTGGCAYSTQRPFSDDFRTVHVEMFHSLEFRRELEFRLTEALIKRIEMDTPYRPAPRNRADVLVSGEVLSVSNRTFGSDLRTGMPREIGSTIAVRFQVKDLRTGDVLLSRDRFVYQSHYIPPVGETFQTGMVRTLDGLAESMVESMESAW